MKEVDSGQAESTSRLSESRLRVLIIRSGALKEIIIHYYISAFSDCCVLIPLFLNIGSLTLYRGEF